MRRSTRLLAVLAVASCLACVSPIRSGPPRRTGGEDAAASFDLGREALRRGDTEAAARHFRDAAEQGHVAAEYALGVLYALGRGVERDRDEALAWYVRSAEQGDGEAQYALAEKLEAGVHGRSDEGSARSWLERLSHLGEPTNPLRVGADYPFGPEGLDADPARAVVWYERAARQSNVMAWYRLGRMYAEGRGVAADRVRAHMFLGLCAERGLGDAAAWTARLAETMSPDELADSRRMAEEWKASTPAPPLSGPRP